MSPSRTRICSNVLAQPLHLTAAIAMLLLSGCSSPDSQRTLDTALCWLRPSCLPSQSSGTRKPPASTPAKRQPSPQASPPPETTKALYTAATLPASCHARSDITISAAKPTFTVSYVEPTTRADGSPLINLHHTTIYHDLGNGLIRAKEIPATNPKGGGRIVQRFDVPVPTGSTLQTTVCISASDFQGHEG